MADELANSIANAGYGLANVFGNIAKTQKAEQEESKKEAERLMEKDAYVVAAGIGTEGFDINQYGPEVQYKGAMLRLDRKTKEYQEQVQSLMKDKTQRDLEISSATLKEQKLQEYYNMFNGYRRAGLDERAIETGLLMNQLMANGYDVKKTGAGYDVTQIASGTRQTINSEDVTIDQVSDLLDGYMKISPEERFKMNIGQRAFTQKNNGEFVLTNSVPYKNESTGEVVYYVPAGTIDPKTGQYRESFWMDATFSKELKDKDVSGFKSMSVIKEEKDIESKKGKPSVVSPSNIVTTEKGQGLILQGEGGAKFTPITGGTIRETPDEGKAVELENKKLEQKNKKYKLLTDQLKTALTPFKTSGGVIEIDENGNFSAGGNNAFSDAMKLIEKSKTNPEEMTTENKRNLPNAQKVEKLWGEIQGFGALTGGLDIDPTKGSVRPKDQLVAAHKQTTGLRETAPAVSGTEKNTMPQKPDPAAHKGRVIIDTATGKREKSDGTNWVEIQ